MQSASGFLWRAKVGGFRSAIRRLLLQDLTVEGQVDADLLLHFHEQHAWVFEAPGDVGYVELSAGRAVAAVHLDAHRHRNRVWLAEECEHPADLDLRRAREGEIARVTLRFEGDGGEVACAELFVRHPL